MLSLQTDCPLMSISTGLGLSSMFSPNLPITIFRLEIIAADTNLVAVVVLLEEHLQWLGQLQAVHRRVRLDTVADGCPCKGLEGKGLFSIDWSTQHWLKKHTRGRILVMMQQLWDVPGHEHSWVMAIKTELVALLLYPGMKTAPISPKTYTKKVLILSWIPE